MKFRLLCLPKTLSGMTRGWAYGNEAANGRVSDPAAACYPVAVHPSSEARGRESPSAPAAGSSTAQVPAARETVEHRSLAVGMAYCEQRSLVAAGSDTVAWNTLRPSMRSSPWIRGAPQRKFSRAIRATKSRTSLEPWDVHLASGHVIDIPKSQTSRYGANARPYRAERSPSFRANLATNATARSKAADQNDGSRGDEFGYASARQFDGAARSLPTAARCGFGVRFGRSGPSRLSPSP